MDKHSHSFGRRLTAQNFFLEVFSNRNAVVMTFTLTIVHFFNNLYLPWWPLYLRELGASVEIIGTLFAVFGLIRIFMSFPGGILADRFGRRRVILFGTALRIVTPALYLLARTWQQLIPGLLLAALTLYGPSSYAIVLESFPAKKRTTGFGVVQTILILSNSLTMILGGILMDQMGVIEGTRLILILTLIFFPIVLALRYRFLSETLHVKKRSQKLHLSFKDLGLRGSVLGMLATKALFWISFSTTILGPFLVLYATDVMGFTKTQWGLAQMVFQMTWAITTVPCGMFADRYSKRTSVFLSLAIGTIPLFSYLFIRDLAVIIVINFLAGIGAAFGGPIYGGGPAWQSLLADVVPSERRARIMGLMNLVSGLSASPFTYVGAYLWSIFSPSATITMAALFSAISTFVFLIAVKEPSGTQ